MFHRRRRIPPARPTSEVLPNDPSNEKTRTRGVVAVEPALDLGEVGDANARGRDAERSDGVDAKRASAHAGIGGNGGEKTHVIDP